LGRAESVQVRKQAALQQLGQTCPGLVRLGCLGHAGPGAQTRPKLHSQAAKHAPNSAPETESDVLEWNAVRCISTPPEKET